MLKTKTILAVCFYFSLPFGESQRGAKAQTNLVPNGNFDIADTCPTTLDQMSRAMYWSSYCESPDYYNTCSTVSGMAPPNTAFGYQQPLSGNAFAGFVTWAYSTANYREIIGAQLTSTLSIGTKYYFSFFVNFAGTQAVSMATDNIGLKFSTVPYSKSDTARVNNFADYRETTIITDTVNWVQIKGSYVPDSVYKYIAIGNFFDDVHTDTLGTGSFNDVAYYYIDNICLSTDSTFAYTTSIQQVNHYKDVSVYPNPCTNTLTIKSNSSFPESVELFDVIGNSCITTTNNSKSTQTTLDVSSLNNGMYILKVTFQNETIQKQIIVQH
jgi:hypothetical protein